MFLSHHYFRTCFWAYKLHCSNKNNHKNSACSFKVGKFEIRIPSAKGVGPISALCVGESLVGSGSSLS